MSDKGQASTLYNVGMAMVMAVIVLSVGVMINQQTAENMTPSENLNFSITFANATWYALPYRASSVIDVANYTNSTSQFIADTDGAGAGFDSREWADTTQVILYTNESYIAGTFNVSYMAYDSDSYSAISNATAGISTIAQWLPVLAVILASAVLIATLGYAFLGRGGI